LCSSPQLPPELAVLRGEVRHLLLQLLRQGMRFGQLLTKLRYLLTTATRATRSTRYRSQRWLGRCCCCWLRVWHHKVHEFVWYGEEDSTKFVEQVFELALLNLP
jgi:hypothetical protein